MALEAKPTILEPVMKVEIEAPVEYAGDLMGDLNGRRGRIAGMETMGSTQLVRAVVPLSEMLSYQNDLTAMTQGRASFRHGVRPLRLPPACRHCKPKRSSRRPRQLSTGEEEEARSKPRSRLHLCSAMVVAFEVLGGNASFA